MAIKQECKKGMLEIVAAVAQKLSIYESCASYMTNQINEAQKKIEQLEQRITKLEDEKNGC